jgi:hypothetical protein
MDDDNSSRTSTAGSPRRRTAAVAAAVGVAGLVAGGVAAGAISAASADGGDTPGRGYGVRGEGFGAPGGTGGDPSQPMRGDEKLLTGTTRAKVLAAVKAKYPDATVQRVETDSEGVYEAHIVDDGSPLVVQVGKDFTITGTQPGGGPGRHGGPGGPAGPGGPGVPEGGAPTTEGGGTRTS